jgi:hypothetical protein
LLRDPITNGRSVALVIARRSAFRLFPRAKPHTSPASSVRYGHAAWRPPADSSRSFEVAVSVRRHLTHGYRRFRIGEPTSLKNESARSILPASFNRARRARRRLRMGRALGHSSISQSSPVFVRPYPARRRAPSLPGSCLALNRSRSRARRSAPRVAAP